MLKVCHVSERREKECRATVINELLRAQPMLKHYLTLFSRDLFCKGNDGTMPGVPYIINVSTTSK